MDETREMLNRTGYVCGRGLATVVFLSLKLSRPLFLEGEAGVGKTEIARRLAKLAQAPFIKIEATKFTEVGYVGRDVESIIRDLVDVAIKMIRETEMNKVKRLAEDKAEERILYLIHI